MPGWRSCIARAWNGPTVNSTPGLTSSTDNVAETAVSGTGNTAGSICRCRISSSDVVPCFDPQMRTVFPGAKNGLKYGNPWM